MKRNLLVFCVLAIVTVFIVTVCFISNSETKYAKRIDFESNQVLAVFYIGGMSNDYDYSVIEKYFTEDEINNFKEIKLDGEEKYLIVPRYKGNVEIYSLSLDENDSENIISTLKDTVSTPFYITCNVSDIFPNSRIKISTRTGEFVYTPYISLKDGSVVTTENVLLVND